MWDFLFRKNQSPAGPDVTNDQRRGVDRSLRAFCYALSGHLGHDPRQSLQSRPGDLDSAWAPRVSRPELKVFSPEEAKVFLEALQGERLEALFTVSVASGLRLGEMLGLRWIDVDLENGSLRVHQALQRVGKKLRFVEPKSDRSRRSVALPSFASEALKRQQEHQRGERLLGGSRWVEGTRFYNHHRHACG